MVLTSPSTRFSSFASLTFSTTYAIRNTTTPRMSHTMYVIAAWSPPKIREPIDTVLSSVTSYELRLRSSVHQGAVSLTTLRRHSVWFPTTTRSVRTSVTVTL